MKRFAGMLFAVLTIAITISFAAQTLSAQEWSQPWARERIEKSPRHSEWVAIKHDGREVQTLIVYPESKEKRPAATSAASQLPSVKSLRRVTLIRGRA